jgi:serine/threonine protein kinase
MLAQLVITAGADKGKSFTVYPGGAVQVGRGPEARARLDDVAVSRVHCEIDWDGYNATILNVSTRGTLVNGLPASSQQPLLPGDVIRVGGTELRFELLAPPGAETASRSTGGRLDLNDLVGEGLLHYAVEAVISRGHSCYVFRARDRRSGQVVALKVLRPELLRGDEDRARFDRTIKAVLPMRHPHLVSHLAAGRTGPYTWLALDYIEGENMNQAVQRLGVAGMLDWKYGYRAAVHVARALAFLHAHGLVHRNITPQNVLMRRDDKMVKLGSSTFATAIEKPLGELLALGGAALADVSYMAPERLHTPNDVDGRADLYALGATVYSMLTGHPPFYSRTVPELLRQINTLQPEKPKKYQLSIPNLFEGALLRLLARWPEERYQTAGELLADLARVGKFTGVKA